MGYSVYCVTPEDKIKKIAFYSYPCSPSWSISIHRSFHYMQSFFFFFPFLPFHPFSLLNNNQTPFTLQLKSAVVIFTHRFLPSCLSFKGVDTRLTLSC